MSNPIGQYMEQNGVGVVEMAARLGLSKGYVSMLRSGEKAISPTVAKALARLTGGDWREYLPEEGVH